MKSFIKNILGYYKNYKLYTGLFFFGVLFGLGVESLTALSFKFLLDNAIEVKNERILIYMILLLVVSTILAKIIYILRFYLYSKVASGITKDVRNTLFKKLQKLSFGYYSRIKSGDVLSYFSMDLDSLESLAVIAIPASIAAVLGIVINIVIIFILEWQLAIIALVGLILCVLGPFLFSARVSRVNDQMKARKSELLSVVEENIGTQKLIRSFNLDQVFLDRFLEASDEVNSLTAKTNFLNKLMEMVPNIIIQTINVAIICIGAYMAFKAYITPGTLVAFNSLFVGLIASVMSLTRIVPIAMKSSASLKRIWQFLDDENEREELGRNQAIAFSDKIEFSNVSFAYEGAHIALKDINLSIPKGASVAIVGASGSGKSSILNLLMGFYKSTGGTVSIDGIDLDTVDLKSLRQMIGIVLQDNILFNTSIRENFKLIFPDIEDDMIVKATKTAEIHDYIMTLPHGYDTTVGERGSNLSNGQRQKLAVARALIYNPSLLIFDEVTAALDHKTEQAINVALKALTPNQTIVTMTHRLDNVQQYDCIYVLDQGSVIESGSHEALIQLGGAYSQMYTKQHGFSVSEDSMDAEIEASRLAQIRIFKALDYSVLEELRTLFVSEFYPAGKSIIEVGEYGDRFYVIVRGKVNVSIMGHDGEEKVVKVLEDGDYFGEIALLRKVPRTANIIAKVPCLVLSLKGAQFEKLLSKTPDLKVAFEKMIDPHLEELEAHR